MLQGILLDTSVVIEHLRGRINLAEKAPPAEPLFLPLTALGELYKGVLKSSVPEKTKAQLEISTDRRCLPRSRSCRPPGFRYAQGCLARSQHADAQIAATLESRGTPIPENDIWIAAVALECSMPLAQRDSHFDRVDGLSLLTW